MKNRRFSLLFIACIIFTFFGCATFSKKRFRKEVEYLEKETVSKLNGNYSFNPIKRYYSFSKPEPKDSSIELLRDNNAYMFLLNKTLNENDKFDSISKLQNNYHLTLNIENNKSLKIQVLENSKIIKDTSLTGHYKNGMFYINNIFLECNGIPYLCGGCRNNKRRIGLTKNGNLLINEAVCNEGALLLIIGVGYSYNLTYEYKRIE